MPDDTTKKSYSYFRATEVYEGKRYEAKGKTQREAEKKLASKIAEVKRGGVTDGGNMTVSQWAKKWLSTYVESRVREPGTAKRRGLMSRKEYTHKKGLVYNYIIPVIGNARLKNVTPSMLQSILNDDPCGSMAHVMHLKQVLRLMFKQAWIDRLIIFDPSANLVIPAAAPASRRGLTAEEKAYFFKAAEKNNHGLLFRFLLATGIRPSELTPLTVGDVDLDRRTVHINKAVEAGTKVVSSPKTESGMRYTIINTQDDKSIIADLRNHMEEKGNADLLFSNRFGRMISSKVLCGYWDSFARQMDLLMGAEHDSRGHIYDPSDLKADGTPLYPDPNDPKKPRNGHKISPDLVAYCLRHTFGTDMQRSGVPINVTKYLMGHSDISVTANVYIDSDESDALIALKLLDDRVAKNVANLE